MKTKTIILATLILLPIIIIGCNVSMEDENNTTTTTQNDSQNNTATPESLINYDEAIAKNFVHVDMKSEAFVINDTSYITSQCYTKPKDAQGAIHNPCYSCHINDGSDKFKPNYFADDELQIEYDFPTVAYENRFSNLFEDRSELIKAISDENITAYIAHDNYKENNGTIILAKKLTHNLPSQWDTNGNGSWDGYVPDCYFNFDDEGFDIAPDGSYTKWRAFRYRPFLGTFWPTNGSTDDVMIRLDDTFTQDSNGDYNHTIYKINLAVVESLIKFQDVPIDAVDENLLGIDLNRNGSLDTATHVAFIKPFGVGMRYVGKAKTYLDNTILKNVARGLFPEGTQFLHSVRYIASDENGTISMAPRMKELRYGKKLSYNNYSQLQNVAMTEIKERHDFPDRTKLISGSTERGIANGLGWVYQGFIEDKNGALRPQNFEENTYCIGCHGNLGATTDTIFSFPRKLDGNDSWLHWSQKGLKGIADKNISIDGETEYVYYLKQNKAGDEFRGNEEIKEKFFNTDGSLKEVAQEIKTDITTLIFPSHKRALELNKAYKIIVDEQSFIRGRDSHVKPLDDVVYKSIPSDQTGIEEAISYK